MQVSIPPAWRLGSQSRSIPACLYAGSWRITHCLQALGTSQGSRHWPTANVLSCSSTLQRASQLTGAWSAQDPYANYVLQSALTVSSGQLHLDLVEAMRPYLPTLRGTPHGKRILSKINVKL